MNRLLVALFSVCLVTLSGFVLAASKAPAEYIEQFVEADVVWFGEVVSARAFRNDEGETVIEWLCRYYELVEPIDVKAYAEASREKKKRPTIKARKKVKEQYFVATIRSPTMPLELATETAAEAKEKTHYALRNARTVFVGHYDGRQAVYIGGGSGVVGDEMDVRFVD